MTLNIFVCESKSNELKLSNPQGITIMIPTALWVGKIRALELKYLPWKKNRLNSFFLTCTYNLYTQMFPKIETYQNYTASLFAHI